MISQFYEMNRLVVEGGISVSLIFLVRGIEDNDSGGTNVDCRGRTKRDMAKRQGRKILGKWFRLGLVWE